MSEPLTKLVGQAFRDTVEAGEIIYAAGLPREIKDDYLAAHSALLRLKTKLAEREGRRSAVRR